MKEIRHITCGIFYCRDRAKINGCGTLQTSSRLDSDVLRNRQQKHTAVRCAQAQKDRATVKNLLQKDKKEKRYNEQPTHKTTHLQAPTHKPPLQLAKEQFSCLRSNRYLYIC